MSLVVFTARAGENVPIPVKALASQEASWTMSGLAGLFDSSQSGFKQSIKQGQAGKRTGLADTLPRVQGILGIQDQFTNY